MAKQHTYYNFPLTGKDKFTKDTSKASIKDSDTLTPIFIRFHFYTGLDFYFDLGSHFCSKPTRYIY